MLCLLNLYVTYLLAFRSDPTENDSIEGLRPNARGPGLVTFGVCPSFSIYFEGKKLFAYACLPVQNSSYATFLLETEPKDMIFDLDIFVVSLVLEVFWIF